MNNENIQTATRLGGYTAIGGTVIGLIGTLLSGLSGTSLDTALAAGDFTSYLTTAGETKNLLVANLTLWIIMVLLFGVAGTAMALLCERRKVLAQIAMYSYWTAAPLAIACFVAWLALVLQIAPDTSPTALLLAETLGWFAAYADWIATILILGSGSFLISRAGRDDWVPTWLARWGIVAAIAGLVSVVGLFAGGTTSYSFLILPVGLGWMIAAGIVLLRSSKKAIS